MSSTVSDVKLVEPTTPEQEKLAEECSNELTEAAEELHKALEAASNLPADPNFTPETVDTGEDDGY